jgi:hypothetical protein
LTNEGMGAVLFRLFSKVSGHPWACLGVGGKSKMEDDWMSSLHSKRLSGWYSMNNEWCAHQVNMLRLTNQASSTWCHYVIDMQQYTQESEWISISQTAVTASYHLGFASSHPCPTGCQFWIDMVVKWFHVIFESLRRTDLKDCMQVIHLPQNHASK